MPKVGTRTQVWHGTRQVTSSGLTRAQLMKNTRGKIVSKRASATAKRKSNLKGFLIRPRGKRKRKKPVRYGS